MGSFNQRLAALNRSVDSLVCVGLDPDPQRLPADLPADVGGVERFLCEIIDATAEFACAFKPNLGFYLALGAPGARLLASLRERAGPGRLLIGDGKWGDIGNTMAGYARARDAFGFDAVTASPYMGWEAVAGLCQDETRGVFMVCRSSNPGRRFGPAGQWPAARTGPFTCGWRARPPPPTCAKTAGWCWGRPMSNPCAPPGGRRPGSRSFCLGSAPRAATWRHR